MSKLEWFACIVLLLTGSVGICAVVDHAARADEMAECQLSGGYMQVFDGRIECVEGK